jgi:hypothetical protein
MSQQRDKLYLRFPRLASEELLPAVDVVGSTRNGGVDHDVYRWCSDVGRLNNPPDGEFGSKLVAAVFKFIAQD